MIEPDPEIEVTSYNSPCSERFIEDMDTEKPLFLQPNLWNAEQIITGSFIKMTIDFLINLEDFSVLVMHCAC